MTTNLIIRFERVLNILGVLGILWITSVAFFYQFYFYELPCPLCLLQRIGFLGVAFGYLRNLQFGFKPSNYAISLLSAIFTSLVALRQIALHIIPGEPTFGVALFGLHFYTWSFITAMLIVIITILMQSVDRQFEQNTLPFPYNKLINNGLFILMAVLIVINIISIFLVCGFGKCPEDPVRYLWPFAGR